MLELVLKRYQTHFYGTIMDSMDRNSEPDAWVIFFV